MTATPRDFGVIHNRAVALSADGRTLDGEDSFTPADGNALAGARRDEFAIRFHLHPAIKANRLADGRGVILLLPDRELWTLHHAMARRWRSRKACSSPARTARAAPCRS